MEENKNFWNKMTDELTVKDQLIVVAITPVMIMGAVVAAGAVLTVADKIIKKFWDVKTERHIKKADKKN